MGSLFHSTRNTRVVPASDNRFIRSDVPTNLSVNEIEWLLSHEIRTVIDLRTPEEQSRKPCCLFERPEFQYMSFPVFGGNAILSTPDEVSKAYIAMCDNQMNRIVKRFWSPSREPCFFAVQERIEQAL